MEFTEASTSEFANVQADELNLRVHYNDIGSGDKVIVMLHGSGPGASGWANFNRNIEPFTSEGYRVILLDFPGWSKSDPVVSTKSRSHLNAAAIKGLLDALKIERAHLVGNSMGAHSAVAFALDNPQRVDKLILMGGGTGGASPFVPMPTEGLKLIATLYRDPTIENLKRMMNVFVYDPSSLTDELFKSRLDNILARKDHCDNFVKSAQVNPRQYPDVTSRLHEVSAQTLIVWGRDDRFVPMDVGLRLLASIKNSQLHVFSQCGHWAQWEHADTFNRLLLDFLKH